MRTSKWEPWLAAAGVLIALLLVATVLTFRNTRQLHVDAGAVTHTHEVLDALEEVNRHLREAESAQRTFVITGGETIPAEYIASIEAARREAAHALELTADNPDQQARLPDIDGRIAALAQFWTRTMEVRQQQGLDAAAEIVTAGTSRRMMAELQDELRQIDATELGLLNARARRTEESYQWALATGLITGVAALACVLAFTLLMRRHLASRERAAQVIAEQRERLRTTLASIGDAVISTDDQGRITNLNAVAEGLTGWHLADALGQPLEAVFRIVNEATRQPAANPANRALTEGVIVGLANHTLLIARDGAEHPIDDSAAPIRCKDGEIVGCVLVFRDITERRQLERELESQLRSAQLLAGIVQNSGDAIISKSLDGTIQTWNPAAERLLGYSAAEAIGRHISLIIPPDRIDEEQQIIAAVKAGQRLEHFDTWRLRGDGTPIQVALTVSPVKNAAGEPVGASKIIRDVTVQRQAAERERRLLEEAVTANLKFRAYFEQGAVFAGLMDVDGTLIEANRLSVEGCGFSRDAAVGKPFWEGPWWSPSPELSERVRQATVLAATGETFHGELPYFIGDGSQRVADVIIVPVKDEAGRVLFLAPIGTDVTERNQIAADCQKFVTVVENSLDFIGMCDLDGRPFYVNPAGLQMVGLNSLDEAKAVHVLDFFFPEDRETITNRFFPSVLEQGQGEIEIRFRNFQTGEHRWIAYKAFPLTDKQNQRVGMATVSQDVTNRRVMEDNLRLLASNLSEADRRKDEFLATLAHELRNPLAPIRNALQILRLSQDSQHIEEARVLMERQLAQMVRLVDDLLDVSRITRGKLDLRKEPVRLSQVIDDAVETSRPLINSMRHELSISLPTEDIPLEADRTRLAQVFANLLNNSAKYMDAGGRIWLSAESAGDTAVITVRDAGIGIAADHLPHVFEMFSQADHSLERAQGGLGIGLTLVKRLVEMHDGEVAAASPGLNQGAVVTVRLPIHSAAAAATPAPGDAETAAPKSRLRILIVDDNRDSADTLSTLLRIVGHETRTAYDGQQGIETAAEFLPHVILLDIGLPRLNGYEACRTIREQPWGRNIALIAVTGWGQDDDRRRSQAAGFDHHLVKPVNSHELIKYLSAIPQPAT